MPVTVRFRALAVAAVAGSLSMGALSACSDASGATADMAPVGTTAGPRAGGAPSIVPSGAPAPAAPRNDPPLWPGAGAGAGAVTPGGALLIVPRRGVEAGGGSTGGVEDPGLLGAGVTALAAAGGLGLVARHRRGEA